MYFLKAPRINAPLHITYVWLITATYWPGMKLRHHGGLCAHSSFLKCCCLHRELHSYRCGKRWALVQHLHEM